MKWLDTGGPAFPCAKMSMDGERLLWPESGMTLREYAAIKLCVPESGIDWLDDMIRQSQRDRFAGQATAGIAANSLLRDTTADLAYKIADAVIVARKSGAA